MPHLKGKEIPMFKAGGPNEPRVRVGTAVVLFHDPSVVEFYVRLEDPQSVDEVRRASVAGLHFQIGTPSVVEFTPPVPERPEYPIHIMDELKGYM